MQGGLIEAGGGRAFRALVVVDGHRGRSGAGRHPKRTVGQYQGGGHEAQQEPTPAIHPGVASKGRAGSGVGTGWDHIDGSKVCRGWVEPMNMRWGARRLSKVWPIPRQAVGLPRRRSYPRKLKKYKNVQTGDCVPIYPFNGPVLAGKALRWRFPRSFKVEWALASRTGRSRRPYPASAS